MLWNEVFNTRALIKAKLPDGTIVPEHTADQHFYRYMPKNAVYASVTTKSGILKQDFVKGWAVNQALEHVRNGLAFGPLNEAASDALFETARNKHTEIFEEAGDIGHRIHKIIEDYLNEWINRCVRPSSITDFIPNNENDSRVISAVRAAEKFCIDHYIIPIHSELLVASPKYKVAGTLDFLAFIGKLEEEGDSACDHEMWQISKKHEEGCTKCSRKIKYELALIDFKSSNSIAKPEYMMQVSTYWECLRELIGLKPRRLIVLRLDKKMALYESKEITLKQRSESFRAYAHLTKTYDWLQTSGSRFNEPDKKVLEI